MSDRPASSPNEARPPRRYRTAQPDVDAAIDALIALLPAASPRHAHHARELVTTAAKLLLDGADLADMKLTNAALKELRYAFKVFKPWRQTRKVTVFGSARTRPDAPAYLQASEFGRRMAELGWMVITGAGGGIMAAAHGGAGREASFGVNIHLPFEQEANETVRGGERLVNFKYFFTRKLTFLKETDAIVLFPGGFGTHDEGFETLTLIQTGKADPVPVVFIEPPGSGYWREWADYVDRHLGSAGLISPDDTRLFRVTDSVDEALDEIARFYRVYHSQRWVGPRLVLRLQQELAASRITALEREFAPLLLAPRMTLSGPLPEEANQPEIAHLPRLVLQPRRDDFAALRILIDQLNATSPDEVRALAEGGPAPPAPEEERAERGATPLESPHPEAGHDAVIDLPAS